MKTTKLITRTCECGRRVVKSDHYGWVHQVRADADHHMGFLADWEALAERSVTHDETPALAAQRKFEAMFDHIPRVDTRTPADIRNGVTL